MRHYAYLIIGGGMAADAAVKGIRSIDTDWEVCVIGAEGFPPYKRPPLTKQLWKGKPVESIWLGTSEHDATLELARTVKSIDLSNKRVTDDLGEEYGFDKLLLATGGTPRRLPFTSEAIIYYRAFDDYNRLRELADGGSRFAVIGAGFIGSEIAAALSMNDKQAVMIFPGAAIGDRMYPAELAASVTDYYLRKGVEVIAGETAVGVEPRSGRHVVKTSGGREIEVDGIIAGVGISPNTQLAEAAGLHVENGIRVDKHLRTIYEDVFAAGDVANFHNPALNKRIRVEHEDNAVTMGKHAGKAMAGHIKPYTHLPYFYSDMFELGYEAVGDLDPQLETFSDWKEPFKEGVVYYLADGRVRGVLLWNVWDKVPAARELISEPGPFTRTDLKGRIA
jgi:3-phenylpropionate/trans-cinnamate dioxygenase ferredoxin reductase component